MQPPACDSGKRLHKCLAALSFVAALAAFKCRTTPLGSAISDIDSVHLGSSLKRLFFWAAVYLHDYSMFLGRCACTDTVHFTP